ncbi:MAG: hypothetical protein FJ290_01480 [Planctomycetes bacterium]|nr:hypothetical protein [Planctomycetota bacterium]
MRGSVACVACAALLCAVRVWAAGVEVVESGASPDLRFTVTSPGVYKAVVWQAAGGGIMEFYDLASDPEAKTNLAGWDRGLFEVGWHGAARPDPDPSLGDYGKGPRGSYGCRDWPSIGHKALKAEGELAVIERSPARVRILAKSVFTFWSRFADRNMPVIATYTFYPAGQIVVQVRVQKAEREFKWSGEYGPHLFLPAPKGKPEANPCYIFSTPKVAQVKDSFFSPSEELLLATSEKVKTTFLLTIPAEQHLLFDRHMRHDGRSVGWDRCGYGSGGVLMKPGYDSTWACMIQVGTEGSKVVPKMRAPKDALPYAVQYRAPAKVTGVQLVGDDTGDFNADGFNESEGCHVLKSAGPVELVYEKGEGAGFAPAFKVLGWNGPAPEKVFVGGEEVPCAAAVVDGRLVLQMLGRVDGQKAKIGLGK